MEYTKVDIYDYFSFFLQNVGNRFVPHALGVHRNTLRSKKSLQDGDSVEKTICFKESKSSSEDKDSASASRKLDNILPRLEEDIQDVGSVGGPNLNIKDLQWDFTTLTSKYEPLQHNACHSREGHQKME